jgi:hypothetical protein
MKINLAPINNLNNVQPERDLTLKNNKNKSEPNKRSNLASIMPIKENMGKVGAAITSKNNTIVAPETQKDSDESSVDESFYDKDED